MDPFPLMNDNITREDIDTLIAFLDTMPRLTQSANVAAFEQEWSRWLGVKHSVYVNSGASANFITISVRRGRRDHCSAADVGFRHLFCASAWFYSGVRRY